MDKTETKIRSHIERSEMWQTLAANWHQRRGDLGDIAKRQEANMRRNAAHEKAEADRLAKLLST